MKNIKLLFAIGILVSSCASKKVTVNSFNSNTRVPASDIEQNSLNQLTNSELRGYAGKNILRVIAACPVSALAIVLSAVAETIPVATSIAGIATEIKSNSQDFQWTNKPATTATVGPIGGIIKDLSSAGYALIFEDSPRFEEGVFKDTKTSYEGTAYLAKHFYSEEGNCGLAGRKLVDTLQEIKSRKK